MDQSNAVSSVNPQIEERQSSSFLSKYKYTLVSLVIILAALIPLIIIAKNNRHRAPVTPPQTAVIQPTTSPTPTPLTTQNAQPTIDAVSQNIQNSITQSNQDISSVNQIDTSQDSVAGL